MADHKNKHILERYIQNVVLKNVDNTPHIDAMVQGILNAAVNKGGITAILLYGSGLWQQRDEDRYNLDKDEGGCNLDPDKGEANNIETSKDNTVDLSDDRIYDFQVLVDDYNDFKSGFFHDLLGRRLPPNVFYKEVVAIYNNQTYRFKFNIIRQSQFERASKGKTFTPQVWARFCQPSRLVYVRDNARKTDVIENITNCVLTFFDRTAKLDWARNTSFPEGFSHKDAVDESNRADGFEQKKHDKKIKEHTVKVGESDAYGNVGKPDRQPDAKDLKNVSDTDSAVFTSHQFWTAGLSATYQDEMRSEAKNRPDLIYNAASDYYDKVFEILQPSALAYDRTREFKRPFRKAVALLRVIKSSLTFENGVDYALWKIERHSGIKETATPLQRKYPLIFGWPLLFRLYQKGAFR